MRVQGTSLDVDRMWHDHITCKRQSKQALSLIVLFTSFQILKLSDALELYSQWQYTSFLRDMLPLAKRLATLGLRGNASNLGPHNLCGPKTPRPAFALITRFMGPTRGPTRGPSGADKTQVGPMLAPWTLLSGWLLVKGGLIIVGVSTLCYRDLVIT